MEYSAEILKKITQYGTLGRSLDDILLLLSDDMSEVELQELEKDFHIKKSPVELAYKKGLLMSDVAIDKALLDKAKEGDMGAIDLFLKRKAMQRNKSTRPKKK